MNKNADSKRQPIRRSNSGKEAISVKDVRKSFRVGDQDIEVLKGITFSIKKGDFVIIYGPSGCGKSTLLHIILGLEPPSEGTIKVMDFKITNQTIEDDSAEFRKNNIGIVYQQSHWVKSLSVRENVAFPLLLLGRNVNEALNRSIEMLELVGMLDWADYTPTELSSGQQQRIALARAMINDPDIIFADEPTGNLDYESGQKMMKLMHNLNTEETRTVIMVTHNLEYLSFANRSVRMFDGEISGEFTGEEVQELLQSIKHLKKVENMNGKYDGTTE